MQPENVQNVQNVLDVLDVLDVLNVLKVSAVTIKLGQMVLKGVNWVHNDKIRSNGLERSQ